MNDSPFSKLPAELRGKIFEFAMPLPEGKFVVSSFGDGGLFNRKFLSGNNRHALMAVCRHVRAEAMPIFYSFDQINFRAHYALQDLEGDRLTGRPPKIEQQVHANFNRDVNALLDFLNHECGGVKRYIDQVRICFGMWRIHRPAQAVFLNEWLSYDLNRIIEYFKGSGVKVYASFSHVDYLETHMCYIAELQLPIWDTTLARSHIENWVEMQPAHLKGFQMNNFRQTIGLCRTQLLGFVESVDKHSREANSDGTNWRRIT